MLRLGKVPGYFLNHREQDRVSSLFLFLVGLFLRGIPELLITNYPVGYETITWYAPLIKTFYKKGLVDVFVETFQSGPLFYVIMWLVSKISGADAFLLLKVAGPVLYGCLMFSFFMFLRRGLNLEWKMAFLATLILVFQPIALRESWDRFRTVLGLFFAFITIIVLKSSHKWRWLFVTALACLTALSREYVAFVLFVTVLGFAVLGKKDRIKSLIVLTPAIVIFIVMVYSVKFQWSYLAKDPYAWSDYLWVVQDVFSIFIVGYLPLLPFVLKGWHKDKLLAPMVGWLLTGSFSVVVSPWFAVPGYQRWLMLLVYPFSVYAVNGFKRFCFFVECKARALKVLVLVFMLIGIGYSTGMFSYVGILPNSYIAINLMQSSIAWSEVNDVRGVLRWLDENAVYNSSMIVEERFYGWTMIYLKRAHDDIKIIPYGANSSPQTALENALENGYQWIYLIWYTDLNIRNFRVIYSLNSISIFQYER
jgi:hypothetical protein